MHPQGKDETKVKAYERLLQYVTFWTTSDEESATVPSTARQLVLAQALRDEMTELGISAVRLSDTASFLPHRGMRIARRWALLHIWTLPLTSTGKGSVPA